MSSALNLEPYWMPFTSNRFFKANPLLMASAKGMYFTTTDGKKILDGIAGLWCCNAGHCHPKIVAAIQTQVATLDYATAFQLGHPGVFELADRLTQMAPGNLDHAFFVNSGSEAVDTALKIAIAYHRVRGEGQRIRLIGRERGYHGVGFGGISVGGMSPNRKMYGALLPGIDHLPHTHDLAHNAFSRGMPEWGAHLADELENIVALHDASTIAAVIVEPVAGSAGVLVPAPKYLQRLREICDRHGILLIFDEVITAFGRTGSRFGAETFGVQPDLIALAKGLTSGAIPMGAVLVDKDIYSAFMTGPEHSVEFFHGYTYSGHPAAVAAGLASLSVYEEEGLYQRASEMAPVLEDAVHSLKGAPHVIDIRNIGMMAAIELEPRPGEPTMRATEMFRRCFEAGLLIRTTGDVLALSPPLIIDADQIGQIVDTIGKALQSIK
ncbi:MAG: aspartate aminotransferase family protein [Gammaproteobacteria bacterium]|nr:MAG: aspartate aminotransferase family protein [Gammaproteobacteria bacterium]